MFTTGRLSVLSVLLISLLPQIGTAEVVESCHYKVKIDRGNESWVSIVVRKGNSSVGQTGRVLSDGEVKVDTTDVVTRSYSGGNLNQVLQETPLSVIGKALKIDLKKMRSATTVFLDETKNNDDMTGATIITLFDANNKAYAKVGQAGWSYGRCQ